MRWPTRWPGPESPRSARLFIYHSMAGWIQSPWLRALVGAALILLPLAPIEIADNGVNSPWYALVALFFGLLWRPKGWAGMTAAALVAFAASSSEILALIYLPLVLLRLAALPRWREHAVTAGWLAGLLVQVPVVLESYAQHTQRLRRLTRPVLSLRFYFHNVALRALGWRVSLHLIQIAGFNGATVIVCAILAAGTCWALVTGTRHSRMFVAVALIMGFVQAVFGATVVGYVTTQQYFFDFEGGSRYSAMPIMGMTAAAAVAVDAYLRRQAEGKPAGGEPAEGKPAEGKPAEGKPAEGKPAEGKPAGGERAGRIPLVRLTPAALAAVATLACVLALGWITDYRYTTERMAWGRWQPKAERLLASCERSTSGVITTWAWGESTITLPCSRLHR